MRHSTLRAGLIAISAGLQRFGAFARRHFASALILRGDEGNCDGGPFMSVHRPFPGGGLRSLTYHRIS